MPESFTSRTFPRNASRRLKSVTSPYQFKGFDPYSSHAVILSFLSVRKPGKILDVGAAHGYMAAAMKRLGYRVTGIEADPDWAQEAALYCEKMFVADLNQPLPAFQESFDVIVCADVLEHLQDPLRVLTALTGSLKPKSQVVVSLPNMANLYVRLHLLRGKFEYQDRGILDRTHLRFFTRRSFLRLLEDAGLQVELLTATPIPLPLVVPQRLHGRLLSVLHAVNAWLARSWPTMFGYQFIAVARKGS